MASFLDAIIVTRSDQPVAIGSATAPIGSGYTEVLSISAPVPDGFTTKLGTRIWHRTTGARIAETWRVHVERSGATYTLSLEDGTGEVSGSAPSLADTLDSGLGVRARIAADSLVIEIAQGAAVRYAQAWAWVTEESNA